MMPATRADCGTVVRQPRQSKGVTLIELLVAMSIGLVLVLGSVTLYARSRATYQTAETLAAMQETLQFALDTLERDIRMAVFGDSTAMAPSSP
jgi:type IV pilus assembly protein PilW